MIPEKIVVIIVQKKNSEYELKKNFISLNCKVEEYSSLDIFFSEDNLSKQNNETFNNLLFLFDGKTFIEYDKEVKNKFNHKYKDANIILMGDFSESYLFSKALLEKSCNEFIVTPFGKKESENLLKRVFHNG